MPPPTPTNDDSLWRMRYLIYQGFARRGAPPSLESLAASLGMTHHEARNTLRELGRRHAVTLTEDGHGVLMANPYSAVPTPYRVTVNGVDAWANCAWDMLGIPAALHADASIEAVWAIDGARVDLRVERGTVRGPDGVVHFQKPFRSWYDDIRDT